MSTAKENIEKLKEALEAGHQPPALKVEKIDTSDWTEFPVRFFQAPTHNATVLDLLGPEGSEDLDRRIDCTFFTVVRSTPEEAASRLRAELYKVLSDKRVRLHGFLSRPSTLEIVGPPADGTEPKEEVRSVVLDLSGAQLRKRSFVAFCFLFAEITMALTPKLVEQELGLKSAVLEGQVHSRA